jgi:hypothetical protein
MYLSLKKGTILYRGVNDLNNMNIKDIPLWLGLDKYDAKLYGDTVIEYELSRDVKLLNIMDLDFHNNYLNILNLIFKGTNYDGVDAKKIEASIPIGLPDYETQYAYLYSKGIKLEIPTNWSLEHERAVRFLLNRHRYSTFERDKSFVTILKSIYGNNCDGYISKIKWASKFHDGFFNREVCLFNPTPILLIQKGGNKKRKIIKKKGSTYDIPKGDSWNRMNKSLDISDEYIKELFENTDINFVLDNLDNLIH